MSLKRKLKREKTKQALSKDIMIAFNIYKGQVPNVGTFSSEQVDELLEKGQICRGRITNSDKGNYFHIIRGPNNFPDKSLCVSDSEFNLFYMTLNMGMERGVDLDDMLSDV